MWQKTKNVYHLLKAIVANLFYGFPSRNMIVIGVTGTDGKTTTSHLIYHILRSKGLNVSLISTIAAIIHGKEHETGFHVTTPDSFTVQKYLAMAKKANSDYVVLEVTSHAIDQSRVWGIPLSIAVLTNVSHEHLDYHRTYENYVKTKFKLLQSAKTAVVNKDDRSYAYVSGLRKELSKTQFVTYGFDEKADMNLSKAPFVKKLEGEYNWANALAAVSVGKLLGLSFDEMEKSLSSFSFPKGRMDIVSDRDFKVIVDFAHTPHALEVLLETYKKSMKSGKLIHVFGSAGERDSLKRPLMGEASSRFADVIILTAEDPRGESVSNISSQIEKGIKIQSNHPVVIHIEARTDAIMSAIEMAQKGDIVLITGKGHEKSMNLGNGEIAWSDHKAAQDALRKRYGADI